MLYIFAPFLAAFTALCTFSVIPYGRAGRIAGYQVNGYVADLPIALLLIFAIGSLGIYGFILGGWRPTPRLAARSTRPAPSSSDEVVLALSVLASMMMSRSLSLLDIVAAEADSTLGHPPEFVGFVAFLMAGTAETARAPVDLPRPSRSSSPATTPSTAECGSGSSRCRSRLT